MHHCPSLSCQQQKVSSGAGMEQQLWRLELELLQQWMVMGKLWQSCEESMASAFVEMICWGFRWCDCRSCGCCDFMERMLWWLERWLEWWMLMGKLWQSCKESMASGSCCVWGGRCLIYLETVQSSQARSALLPFSMWGGQESKKLDLQCFRAAECFCTDTTLFHRQLFTF